MRWTEERIEELRTYWAKGLSASSIAARFGDVSRCAVLGKVYRLGLQQRVTTLRINSAQPHGRRAVRTPSAAGHPWSRPRRRSFPARPKFRLVTNRTAPAAHFQAVEAEDAGARMLPLLELEASMCRWPIGDPKREGFGFCGRTRAPGISYCPRHARVAFRPDKRCWR